MTYTSITGKSFYISKTWDDPVEWKTIGTTTVPANIKYSDEVIGNVMVDPQDLAELRDDSALLYALIDAGVEDWEKFGEALDIYREKRDNVQV